MKKTYVLFALIFSASVFGQQISVDTSSFTPTELTSLLLESSCIDFSNVSSSSSNSVAYFNENGSGFSMQEGIVIRNGNAAFTAGAYTGLNVSTEANVNTDADLQLISNNSGQTAPITDVAFLQFDFVSESTDFNFNFLFASNEYGEWQCGFSDVFAFLITDLNTNTTSNLAIIPGTTTPVSVKDVRDNAYNSSCPSVNSSFFDTYNVGNPNSIMNMRGYTQQMTASAVLQPNTNYRIRLMVGDYSDSSYDSAVFIESGSFTSSFSLGDDVTLCSGNEYIIQSGLDFSQYTISWEKDGVPIAGEVLPNLTINEPGVYAIVAQKNGSSCLLSDEITFFDLQTNTAVDLSVCDDGSANFTFNLLENNAAALGVDPTLFGLVYYASQEDLDAAISIPSNQLLNYSSAGNQTIFIKLLNLQSNAFCDAVFQFDLNVNSQFSLEDPEPISLCEGGTTLVNLLEVNSDVLNGQSADAFLFTYYVSEDDAIAQANPITNPSAYLFPTGETNTTIWITVSYITDPNCFEVTFVDITLNPIPEVDTLPMVVECASYELPALIHGNYFSQQDGQGTAFFAGDLIEDSGVYFIYNGPDENGCSNESNFEVILMDEYTIAQDYCDFFTVPQPIEGNFYTEPNGPNGIGDLLPTDTVLDISQTIYFYVEINGIFCRDEPFLINIISSPVIEDLADVVTCDSYVLPVLTNGNYFSQPNGNGVPLFAGNTITATQNIYIYAENGICSTETSFLVTILNEPVPIEACGSYTLPNLPLGNYFTEANGNGVTIPTGTVITDSQTVYWFAETTTANNCTSNYSIPITIYPIPEVSSLSNIIVCIDTPYVLPTIEFGNYFTAPNGGGIQMSSGDVISTTQTLYIFNETPFCSNQSSFTVTVRQLPLVSNITDVFICEPFVLPALANGNYFTQPNGQGDLLFAGDVIDVTQTLYIFNNYSDLQGCSIETSFTVNVLGVDVGTFTDLAICDSYTLPILTVGNYYSEPLGQGIQYQPGQIITNTTTFYVYQQNGNRFFCDDEEMFTVSVYTTPSLPSFPDLEGCGSVTLPTLFPSGFVVDYYSSSGGVDIINPSEYTVSTPGTYMVYVFAKSDPLAACFDETSFEVTVYPSPELELESVYACVDLDTNEVIDSVPLTLNLSPIDYTANWYFNGDLVGTGLSYLANEIGIYDVETIRLTEEAPPTDCNYAPTTIEVLPSSIAVASLSVSDPFEANSSITVNIENGFGQYIYQLDNGEFQSDPVFYNISPGLHYVTVVDELGNCGDLLLEAILIDYPNYFTPNGDGINDFWNIKDLTSDSSAFISIFDRYGKLLKRFSPMNDNWDGRLNGIDLPSSDYWFTVQFTYNGVNKEFKSHFTLKR